MVLHQHASKCLLLDPVHSAQQDVGPRRGGGSGVGALGAVSKGQQQLTSGPVQESVKKSSSGSVRRLGAVLAVLCDERGISSAREWGTVVARVSQMSLK